MAEAGGSQQMNLTAVRRHDPYASELVESATQVAVYEYGAGAAEWKKTDMQGAFFVYKRSGPPLHSFMVLNRLNTVNLIQPLTSDMDWQLQAPFLLYRTTAGSIFGLWFFYEAECSRLATRLQTLCQPVGGEATQDVKPTTIDLMSLFKKASAGAPTVAPPIARTPGGGSGSRPTTPRTADDQKPSGITVADLFAKASKSGQVTIGKQTVRSISVSEVEDAMPDLGGRPRAATHSQPPQLSKQLSQPARVRTAAAVATPSKDGSVEAASRQAGDVDRIHQLFRSDLKLVSSDPVPVPKPAASARTPQSSAPVLAGCDSSPAVLMSPMMFSAMPPPSVADTGSSGAAGDHAAAEVGGAAWSAAAEPEVPAVTALTRQQLLQALNYLLRNDDAFIDQLHEAYVKSLQQGLRRA